MSSKYPLFRLPQRWNLTLGPHAFPASTLPATPTPQPQDLSILHQPSHASRMTAADDTASRRILWAAASAFTVNTLYETLPSKYDQRKACGMIPASPCSTWEPQSIICSHTLPTACSCLTLSNISLSWKVGLLHTSPSNIGLWLLIMLLPPHIRLAQ